jgi:uncharacterized protein
MTPTSRPRRAPPDRPTGRTPGQPPLTDREIDELQTLLDAVPAPLEPLDVSSLDGFLCAVLVQPAPVPRERWLAFVTDADGRSLPAAFDATRLHALVARREAELRRAIGARTWFDPWLFELGAEPRAGGAEAGGDEDGVPTSADAVVPWAAGFAMALETFPGLLHHGGPALTEPLALIYRHVDADDLEDADDLIAAIDATEPPSDLAEETEELVRATLLLADVAALARRGHRR